MRETKVTFKYLCYEIKKSLWAIVVLSALCTLPYVAMLASMSMIIRVPVGDGVYNTYLSGPNVEMVFVELAVLCYLAPMFVYSFKMNKRSVDAYYSLPIKREKLYLVKTVVGLLIAFVPFTVAHFAGMLTLALRPDNPYRMVMYIPAYFGGLLFGLCLYGVNAFLYTRANRMIDGVVFMIGYAFIAPFCIMYYEEVSSNYTILWYEESATITFGAFTVFPGAMSQYMRGFQTVRQLTPFLFIYHIVLGAVGYLLFFVFLKKEKGENAEQVSESWFGYKVLIPFYVAMFLALSEFEFGAICVVLVGGIVALIVYRQKFVFSWKWWVMLAGAVCIGLLLCGMIELMNLPVALPSPETYHS